MYDYGKILELNRISVKLIGLSHMSGAITCLSAVVICHNRLRGFDLHIAMYVRILV